MVGIRGWIQQSGHRVLGRTWSFLVRLARRAEAKDLFFMAGAITFNLLVAIVPLILLLVGVVGYFLDAYVDDPGAYVVGLLVEYLPAIEGEIGLVEDVRRTVGAVVAERTGISLAGALFFLWISTRLISTLRTVLREVFELERDRGLLLGKLFDAQIVILGSVLLLLNIGVTVTMRAIRDFGIEVLGLEGWEVEFTHTLFAHGLSLGSAWVLFLLIYRFVPAERTPWRVSVVAATFTAVVFELMKLAFAWYVTDVARYTTAFGHLATAAVLFFWIYYSSAVFILGGHVGYVYQEMRGGGMRDQRRGGDDEREEPAQESRGEGAGTAVSLLAAAALGASLLLPGPLHGQAFLNGTSSNGYGGELVFEDRVLDRGLELDEPLVGHDGEYVVVHLDRNKVFLVDGTEITWAARAGTGHGFELEGQGQEWTFTTPVGHFRVQRKDKDPVWVAPDWYFVQRNIPIPARNDPSRRISGTLGTSALFLGDGIAIHGTNRPDLLLDPDPEARRVSHGCIRLTNEAARELYHRVSVGTPVLIF